MLVARASSTTQMEISMRVSGTTIKLMASAYTLTKKELSMKVTGRMISNTDREWSHGMRDRSTRDPTLWARKRAMGSTSGQTVLFTRASGSTTE